MKSISKSFIHQCLHFYRVMSAERNKQIRANSSLTINNRHRYKLSPIDKNWQNLYLLKEKMVAVLHGDRSDRFTQEVLQGVPSHAARPSAIVCWPVKKRNTISSSLAPSTQSNMTKHERGWRTLFQGGNIILWIKSCPLAYIKIF